MKKLFLTGGTGFIGQNILPILEKSYEVVTINRKELDLLKESQVKNYFRSHLFDAVIHCANPNPVKSIYDRKDSMTEDSLRIFFNLYSVRDYYGKMIYFGSGAEYDKSKPICSVREEECFRSIPYDSYGLAKYIMNQIAQKSDNIYNLCLFGCYGPNDYHTKFITHCIRSNILKKNITIRKDCWFDYLHVYDLAYMVSWMVDHNPKYHMYNTCSGIRKKLSDIAALANELMGSNRSIQFLSEGMANEYTASNKRWEEETGMPLLYSLRKGMQMQIDWEINHWNDKTVFDGC